MRALLAWVIYGFIPDSGGVVTRYGDWPEGRPQQSIIWAAATVLVFILWLILLMYIACLWRDHLDCRFIAFAKFAEEVMLGKKSLLGSGCNVRDNVESWVARILGLDDEDKDMSTLKVERDQEIAAKHEV